MIPALVLFMLLAPTCALAQMPPSDVSCVCVPSRTSRKYRSIHGEIERNGPAMLSPLTPFASFQNLDSVCCGGAKLNAGPPR